MNNLCVRVFVCVSTHNSDAFLVCTLFVSSFIGTEDVLASEGFEHHNSLVSRSNDVPQHFVIFFFCQFFFDICFCCCCF